MSIRKMIYGQFGRPTGALGLLAGWIMATRASNRKRNRWTVELLGIRPGDHVLEIGFGPGLSIEDAASRVGAGAVFGIDHSDVMVRAAAKRNRRFIHAGSVSLRQGGLERLGELPGPFDRIFWVNVIQFMKPREDALRTLHASLKPAGVLATTYQPRHSGATATDAQALADRLEQELRLIGFRDIRTETLPLTPVPAVCVLAARAADA